MKRIIKTDQAPRAIGPYSQAVAAGDFLFTAGQIAIAPDTNELIRNDIREQSRQVLENLKAIIEAAGADLASVVRTTVYLTSSEDFTSMNEVYAGYFKDDPPARTTIFVSALPKGALVEIDAIVRL
jgi:2-iminobutanoate/2-iminopropanoate deaminase